MVNDSLKTNIGIVKSWKESQTATVRSVTCVSWSSPKPVGRQGIIRIQAEALTVQNAKKQRNSKAARVHDCLYGSCVYPPMLLMPCVCLSVRERERERVTVY